MEGELMRATIGLGVRVFGAAMMLSLAFAGSAMATNWANDGWFDRHFGYPQVPNGLAAINSVFGTRCTSDSNFNKWTWGAEGTIWNVNFHKKLGGAPTGSWYLGNGGGSTNLFYDIRGHIGNSHWDDRVLGGIGGYNCRLQSGSTTLWSTHAWGIAIDMNWNYEHVGHCHNHTVSTSVAGVFQNHGWTWLPCDAMHFQYATGY